MTAHDRLRVRVNDDLVLINIEASAALADWGDIYRADDGGRLYALLVDRAVAYLPMSSKAPKLKCGPCAAVADPETGARLVRANDSSRVARVRADAGAGGGERRAG